MTDVSLFGIQGGEAPSEEADSPVENLSLFGIETEQKTPMQVLEEGIQKQMPLSPTEHYELAEQRVTKARESFGTTEQIKQAADKAADKLEQKYDEYIGENEDWLSDLLMSPVDAAVAVNKTYAKDLAYVASDIGSLVSESTFKDAKKKIYEYIMDEPYASPQELRALRVQDPEAWRKQRNKQGYFAVAGARGIMDALSGMAGLVVNPDKLINKSMATLIFSKMGEEGLDMLFKPEDFIREEPFAAGMMLLGAASTPARVGGKIGAAAQALKDGGMLRHLNAAQAMVGLPGPIGAVQMLPGHNIFIPRYLLAGEVAADKAWRAKKAGIMASLINSDSRVDRFMRSFYEVAPDAPRAVVEAAAQARRDKAGRKASVERWEKELNAAAGFKKKLFSEQYDYRKVPEYGQKYLESMDKLDSSDDAIRAFTMLHSELQKYSKEIRGRLASGQDVPKEQMHIVKILDEDPKNMIAAMQDPLFRKYFASDGTKLSARAKLMQQAEESIRSGEDVSDALKPMMKQLNKLLAMKKNAGGFAKILLSDEAGWYKQMSSTLRKARRAVGPMEAAEILARKRLSLENYGKGLDQLDQAFGVAEELRGQGAWISYNGRVLGGADGVMEIVSDVRKALKDGALSDEAINSIVSKMYIDGPDIQYRAVLEAALPMAIMSARNDLNALRHAKNLGIPHLQDENVAVMMIGARFNKLRDPVSAAEMDPELARMNPYLRMEEQEAVHHLDLTEKVDQMLPDQNELLRDPRFAKLSGKIQSKDVNGEKMNVFVDSKGVQWVKLPDNEVALGGVKVPRWGYLRGKWAQRDIAEQLQSVLGFRLSSDKKILQLATSNKIINNVSSHRNALTGEINLAVGEGVDMVVELPRAMSIMAGRGNKADELMYRHATEDLGIVDSVASNHIRDALQNTHGNRFNQVVDALLGYVGIRERRAHKRVLADHRSKGQQVSEGIAKLWYEDIQGVLGLKRALWDARDKANRLAIYSDELRKQAKIKYGYGEADMRDPAKMARVLQDKEIDNLALNKSVDLAMDYAAVPRGPRIFGGAGAFDLYRRYASPWSTFALKSQGLLFKQLASRPMRVESMRQLGYVNWDTMAAEKRDALLRGSRKDNLAYRVVNDDGSAWNTMAWAPYGTMLFDIGRDTEGAMIHPIADGIIDSLRGTDKWGREIKSPFIHAMKSLLLTSTQARLLQPDAMFRPSEKLQELAGYGPSLSRARTYNDWEDELIRIAISKDPTFMRDATLRGNVGRAAFEHKRNMRDLRSELSRNVITEDEYNNKALELQLEFYKKLGMLDESIFETR